MSKEEITCTECGYVYRGCAGVNMCPRCEELSEMYEDEHERREALQRIAVAAGIKLADPAGVADQVCAKLEALSECKVMAADLSGVTVLQPLTIEIQLPMRHRSIIVGGKVLVDLRGATP